MQTITDTDPATGEKIVRPMTIDEIELESRHKRASKMVREGTKAPRAGEKLYITTSRGIASRRRAGLDFGMTEPREIEIVTGDEATVAARVAKGESVCSELGYFDLVGDNGLVCHRQPFDAATLDSLQAQAGEAQRIAADNESLRQQLLEARAQIAAKPADAKTEEKTTTTADSAIESGKPTKSHR